VLIPLFNLAHFNTFVLIGRLVIKIDDVQPLQKRPCLDFESYSWSSSYNTNAIHETINTLSSSPKLCEASD
jgi:hypothetical protein